MKVIQYRGREDKLEGVARILSSYELGKVLDLGCDVRRLASLLRCQAYIGVDIGGEPDIFVDLNKGIPFINNSFDTVIALDVLEHLHDIHFVFDEMLRVARKYIVIGLPNMYEWHFRVEFLLGKNLSEKYGLPPDKPMDRHCWLFSLNEARTFVKERAARKNFYVTDEILGYYKYNRLMARLIGSIGRRLGWRGVNLFGYSYLAILTKSSCI